MTINGGYLDCTFCLPFLENFILKTMKQGRVNSTLLLLNEKLNYFEIKKINDTYFLIDEEENIILNYKYNIPGPLFCGLNLQWLTDSSLNERRSCFFHELTQHLLLYIVAVTYIEKYAFAIRGIISPKRQIQYFNFTRHSSKIWFKLFDINQCSEM